MNFTFSLTSMDIFNAIRINEAPGTGHRAVATMDNGYKGHGSPKQQPYLCGYKATITYIVNFMSFSVGCMRVCLFICDDQYQYWNADDNYSIQLCLCNLLLA